MKANSSIYGNFKDLAMDYEKKKKKKKVTQKNKWNILSAMIVQVLEEKTQILLGKFILGSKSQVLYKIFVIKPFMILIMFWK